MPERHSASPTVGTDDRARLRSAILDKLCYSVGKDPVVAQPHDWLTATILALRDRLIDAWMPSTRRTYESGAKRVYYLSLEFLIGRLLRDALTNLGLTEALAGALADLGVELDVLAELEPDAALGNGGLGRLAACFMESMASLDIPAHGYGIRYENGLFRQQIEAGRQVEVPEDWLVHGNPWEFERRESRYRIGFGGTVVEGEADRQGQPTRVWRPAETLYAVAYDTPVAGWRGRRVNTLRLWSAQALDPISLERFNAGDHLGALAQQAAAETLTRVLYPSDATAAGQELRLRQEYFFTSASIQDILRRHMQHFGRLDILADKAAIQLNDTHPALAVAELIRLLVDDYGMGWSDAVALTRATIAYTNHTLLPEALETWPVGLMERLLPRHLDIIYRINAELLADAARRMPGVDLAAVSLIDEHNGRRVRMGQLAVAGSHSVNGVSALHTDLMKKTVFADLNRLFPDRIRNKTNGVTPRRWLFTANPGLTGLIVDTIGPAFLDDLDRLRDLEAHAEAPDFRQRFRTVKRANKARLAEVARAAIGVAVAPEALFDVHVKRIHEYKRQLLNLLHTVALYREMKAGGAAGAAPRVKIFAGKAAASYGRAKDIIRLANDIAAVVNADRAIGDRLKVAFLPNYNVSLAEVIIPATDLSEQISTAGMEASGTGNMKLALNGALTIGTLDGANVEMRDHVGAQNMLIFGLTAEGVAARRAAGLDAGADIAAAPALADALAAIEMGVFSPDEPGRYQALVHDLRHADWFLICADFAAYVAAQQRADALWHQPETWDRMAILNTARMAWFSSDRTIADYAADIWGVPSR